MGVESAIQCIYSKAKFKGVRSLMSKVHVNGKQLVVNSFKKLHIVKGLKRIKRTLHVVTNN